MSAHSILAESLPAVSYVGTADNQVAIVFLPSRVARQLPPRTDVRDHSPDGFAWGYTGSGPAQLALALLCDFFFRTSETEDLSLRIATALYQIFKDQVVASLATPWEISAKDLATIAFRIAADYGFLRSVVEELAADAAEADGAGDDARAKEFAVGLVARAFAVAPASVREVLDAYRA